MKAKDKKDKTFPVLKGKIPIDTEEELAKKLFEKKIFLLMVAIYCKAKKCKCDDEKKDLSSYKFEDEIDKWIEKNHRRLQYKIGSHCYEIIKNAFKHINRCPHSFYKTFCHHCPTKCYTCCELEDINPIMAYSGKRILFKHPIMGIRFVINVIRAKRIIKSKR